MRRAKDLKPHGYGVSVNWIAGINDPLVHACAAVGGDVGSSANNFIDLPIEIQPRIAEQVRPGRKLSSFTADLPHRSTSPLVWSVSR